MLSLCLGSRSSSRVLNMVLALTTATGQLKVEQSEQLNRACQAGLGNVPNVS